MKILILFDSFKGSISAIDAGKKAKEGILSLNKEYEVEYLPIADGGENTIEAIQIAMNMEKIEKEVSDPLGRKIKASYCLSKDKKTAVVEMASASGLTLLKNQERNPLKATTYGTGQLIMDAIKNGAKKIIITVGGSSTNDGGLGCIMAMGLKALDKNNNPVNFGGGSLKEIQTIIKDDFEKNIQGVEFIAACDVENILLGENGATYIFSAQKGADENMKKVLEENMSYFAKKSQEVLGQDYSSQKGSGAGGGMGFAIISYMKGSFKSGFQLVAEVSELEEKIKNSQLIITGEGRMDRQTLMGKAPYGVLELSQKYNKEIIGVCGIKGEDAEELIKAGFKKIISLTEICGDNIYSFENPDKILQDKNTWEEIFK